MLFFLHWSPRSIIASGQNDSWDKFSEPTIPGGVISQIISDPTDSNHLYALQEQKNGWQTITESVDAAKHWNTVANLYQYGIHTLQINPVHTNLLYLGSDSGIYRSDKEGAGWEKVADFGPAVAVVDDNIVYAIEHLPSTPDCPPGISNFMRSYDQGNTWEKIPLACGIYGEISSAIFHPEFIYINEINPYNGNLVLARSLNGGDTWVYISLTGPLFTQGLFPIAIDPKQPEKLYSSSGMGIIISKDGGQTWESKLDISVTGRFLFSFSNDQVYAGLETTLAGALPSIYRSQNGGETWIRLPTHFSTNLKSLLADPGPLGYLYAGLDGFGVDLSLDGGYSWYIANDGLVSTTLIQRLAVAPDPDNDIFAITDWPRPALFKTFDDGITWNGPLLESDLDDVVINPQNAKLVWAVGESGWFESQDGGDTWKLVSYLSGTDLSVSNDAPDRPCATQSTIKGGYLVCRFQVSRHGERWKSFPVPGSKSLSRLAISPNQGNLIFVGGTLDNQVSAIFQSNDGGHNWKISFQGPENYALFDLAISDGNQARVIAVFGQYHPDHLLVYESQDTGQTWHDITPLIESITGDLWSGFTHRAFSLFDTSGDTYFSTRSIVVVRAYDQQSWEIFGEIDDRIEASTLETGSSRYIWLAGDRNLWRKPLLNNLFTWLPLVSR
jgi:photosystem II stability/assembly factor-like uncharacterized protein